MSVEGKRILVTGSSRGIGRAIAHELAGRGAIVVVHGSRESKALSSSFEEVRKLSPQSIKAYAALSEADDIAELFETIKDQLGGIDVLVNNAATQNPSPLIDMRLEDWDFVMAVNLRAPFLCGQYAARMMRDQGKGGKIVNVSSVHSQAPRRDFAHYSSAKGGLEQLTRCMALELADFNIQVNALTVGAIATELTPPDRAAAIATAIPAGRVGSVEEVARLVAFTASDECDYLTGACITVDGGLTLGFCANRRDL
jgi:NAD(P)-dependent dehydrogenase (short-subunit alcohol dehydrogenase family)